MRPISSASGMKAPGGIMPLLGMVPADQRLEAADLVAREIDHRLVVQLELAGRQRLAQVVLHARRACICASISGSKKRKVPRPSPLAR